MSINNQFFKKIHNFQTFVQSCSPTTRLFNSVIRHLPTSSDPSVYSSMSPTSKLSRKSIRTRTPVDMECLRIVLQGIVLLLLCPIEIVKHIWGRISNVVRVLARLTEFEIFEKKIWKKFFFLNKFWNFFKNQIFKLDDSKTC